MAKTPAKRGRSSTWDAKIGEEICHRLEKGEPLTVICRDDHMPASRTVYDWMDAHPDFGTAIAQARTRGFDAIAEDCLLIADDTSRDTKIVGEDEKEVANTEWISRSKLRVDTRLKLLAKWDPKRYGDKVALTDGEGGGLFSGLADTIAEARRRVNDDSAEG